MPNWQDFVCKEKDLVGEMPKSRNRLWISLEMIRAQKLDGAQFFFHGLNDLYIPEMTGFLPLMNSAPAIAMWHLDQSQCTTHWYHPLGILRPVSGFPPSWSSKFTSTRKKKQPMCNLPPIWGSMMVYVNSVSMSVYVNLRICMVCIIHVLKFSFRHVENGWKKLCIASPVRWECHPKTATVCMTNCS